MNRLITGLLLALAMVVSSCTNGADGEDPGVSATGLSLDEVHSELEGLSPQERRARLLELALEEDEGITLYTSLSIDDAGPLVEEFEDQFDIAVDLYRASGSTVAQRLIQEAQADFPGADVVLLNGTEMTLVDDEGLLTPLTTPVTDELASFVVYENWAGVYIQVFAASWNTDVVDATRVPESWEQVLTDYPGALAMELGDFDWFATLVKDYFVAEKGLSEEAAIELFREGARGSLVVDGHTLMAELLAGGSFDVAASPYQQRIDTLINDGAPVAWEPAVEPLVARPNGVGIHVNTQAPATSLLFVEWTLTDAQDMMYREFNRTPTNQNAEGGIPADYEVLTVDLEALLEEREKWEGLYETVVTQSGQDVVGK